MKLDVKLRAGSAGREHLIELDAQGEAPGSGQIQFTLDSEAREANWSEIEPGVYSVLLGGRSHRLHVAPQASGHAGNTSYEVSVGKRRYHVEVRDPRRRRHSGAEGLDEGPQEMLAPMPGKIVRVMVEENQEVAQGQGLLVIEAMKMQNEMKAPRAGRVGRVYVKEGTGVEAGFKLLRLV